MPRPRNQESTLVLPAGRSQSMEPQTFPGFPGVFTPGKPVALSDLGLTSAEATSMIREMWLPLVQAKSDATESSEE